jgi:hypothetical protein
VVVREVQAFSRCTPVALIDDSSYAAGALDAFGSLARVWKLSPSQEARIVGLSECALHSWRQRMPIFISPDTLERLSYLLRVFGRLCLFNERIALADDWLRISHAAFDGDSPLQRMLDSMDGLVEVLIHLDSVEL